MSLNYEDPALFMDDGFASDEKIAMGELGANLPAGETGYTFPHNIEAEGMFFCPITQTRFTNFQVGNLLFEIKDGKLIIDNIDAEYGLENVIDIFKKREIIDKERYGVANTYSISELGFGSNPNIKQTIGYPIVDEKRLGTVHLGVGGNAHGGGPIDSTMHWDFVSSAEINVEVEYTDGSYRTLYKNGKLADI